MCSGLVGILAVCGGMYFLASRIEPHWVSKDRSRFLTVAQDLDHHGLPIGRRRDVRVQFAADQRSLVVGRRSLMRSNPALWTVKSKSEVSRRRLVYVLRPVDRAATSPCSPSVCPITARSWHNWTRSSNSPATMPRCAANGSGTAPISDRSRKLRKFPAVQECRHRIRQPIEIDEEGVVAVR